MSLTSYPGVGIEGFNYALAAIGGIIAEQLGKDIAATETDMGRDPTTGKLNLYGVGCDEVTNWTTNGIMVADGIAEAQIGDVTTDITETALAGHANTAITAVVTSLSSVHDAMKFERLTVGGVFLPYEVEEP